MISVTMIYFKFNLYVFVDELFFMKTCSLRDAQPSLYKHYGIFSLDPPEAHYGMTPCENIACRFCFPIKDVLACGRQNQPVVQFSTAQKHRFVNGYEVILNCPTVDFPLSSIKDTLCSAYTQLFTLVLFNTKYSLCTDMSLWSIRLYWTYIRLIG